jgi:hypothetical protein
MSMPDLATLKQLFRRAPFVADLGMELESPGAGECVRVGKGGRMKARGSGLLARLPGSESAKWRHAERDEREVAR